MKVWTPLLLLIVFLSIVGSPLHVQAQDTGNIEQDLLEKAQVLSTSESSTTAVLETDIQTQAQMLTVKVLDGVDKGKVVTFYNNYTQLKQGQELYVRHQTGGDAVDGWSVSDPYRLNVLAIVAIIFVLLVFMFGGIQGIRGLASLAGSLVLIFVLLLPGIYAGYSPILLSLGVASLIIVAGSYITHGFTRTTTAAVIGMLTTVLITGLATYIAIHAARLSGFTSEQNVYLNFNTDGKIDMVGLLYGGIMIGLLGVLYDIAIGQAVAVEELFSAGSSLTRNDVYKKGIRIGREHIGALINTLAIAYVGTALPLLLLFRDATTSVAYVINSELFATEIIRILMGSIGLVLAVPITTFIASRMLSPGARGGAEAYAHSSPHHKL